MMMNVICIHFSSHLPREQILPNIYLTWKVKSSRVPLAPGHTRVKPVDSLAFRASKALSKIYSKSDTMAI